MRPTSRSTDLPARWPVAAAMAALVAAVALLMTGCGGGNATDGDGAPPAEEATAEPTPTVRIVVPDRAKALGAGGMPGPAGR